VSGYSAWGRLGPPSGRSQWERAIFNPLTTIGKFLITIGLILVGAGLVIFLFSKTGLTWRLPGDIFVQRKNLIFYFPIVTMLVLSVVLTIILNIFFRR